jgi:hypothetical protein
MTAITILIKRLSFLLLPMCLLACNQVSNVGDPMFPLGEGRQWTYQSTTVYDDSTDPAKEDLVMSARGSETVGDQIAWRRRSDSGVDYWLRFDDTGTYRVASKTDVDRDPKIDPEHRYVLRKPYVVGTEWSTPTSAFILERPNEYRRQFRNTHKPFPITFRIEAVNEKVTTPSGSFEGCLKVSGRAVIKLYVDALGVWDDVPLTSMEWYCPNVGLVKLVRLEKSPSKLVRGGELTMQLVAWK